MVSNDNTNAKRKRVEFAPNSVLSVEKLSDDGKKTRIKLEFHPENLFCADWKAAVQEIVAHNIAVGINEFIHKHERMPKGMEIMNMTHEAHIKTEKDIEKFVHGAVLYCKSEWFTDFGFIAHAVERAYTILDNDVGEAKGGE